MGSLMVDIGPTDIIRGEEEKERKLDKGACRQSH